ncbi:hypothetical protein DL96DRAFT_1636093 [Flagelloscypha sp. PMI_526]|nr:hypothetical protein DL96DRAFT_1636093 [Flagelloscypha sp. PMI_526]
MFLFMNPSSVASTLGVFLNARFVGVVMLITSQSASISTLSPPLFVVASRSFPDCFCFKKLFYYLLELINRESGTLVTL